MTAPDTPTTSKRPVWPRMAGWCAASLLLTLAGLALAPQQLPVSLYKLSLVTTAAVLGYWIDRSLFPYARPDSILSDSTRIELLTPLQFSTTALLMSAAMLRRAVVVAATMLAVGLGA